MKILLICFISLLLISCKDQKKPTIPESPVGWKLIGESDNSTYSIYEKEINVDEGKYGKFVRFWILRNYIKNVDKKTISGSSKTKFVMSCKRKHIRVERVIQYSKFNGEGETITDSGVDYGSNMEEIVPQSIGETYYELLCNDNQFSKYLFVPVK